MHRVNLYNYRMSKVSKTEHNGAKNGGGYWGSRAIAKQHSKKRRRRIGRQIIRSSLK